MLLFFGGAAEAATECETNPDLYECRQGNPLNAFHYTIVSWAVGSGNKCVRDTSPCWDTQAAINGMMQYHQMGTPNATYCSIDVLNIGPFVTRTWQLGHIATEEAVMTMRTSQKSGSACLPPVVGEGKLSRVREVICPYRWTGVYSGSPPGGYCYRLKLRECEDEGTCPGGGGLGGSGPSGAGPGVGNPINTLTTAKIETVKDLSVGGRLPVDFVRTYKSEGFHSPVDTQPVSDGFGDYWRHNFQRAIRLGVGGLANTAYAYRSNGGAIDFRLTGGLWSTSGDNLYRLTELKDGAGVRTGWELQDGADRKETYNAQGQLLAIVDRAGARIDLIYSDAATPAAIAPRAGLLIGIVAESGRSIGLTYRDDERIVALQSSDGQVVTYSYDSQRRLEKATHSDASVRTYLYGELAYTAGISRPFFLTGVIDESAQRYSTFEYHNTGAGKATSHAGVGRYSLTYGGGNSNATVVNPLGLSTTIYFSVAANSRRLDSVSTPCPDCGLDKVASQTYSSVGFRDRVTDFRGIVTDYDYNTRGLETQRIDVANTSCPTAVPNCLLSKRKVQTDWHPNFRVPIERRTYNAANTLEQVTRYAYNARGQQTARCQVAPTHATAMAYACGSAVNAPTGVRQSTIDYCDDTDVDFGSVACARVGLVRTVDGPRTDVSDVTTYAYRAADDAACAAQPTTCAYRKGDLWKTTNALGQVSEVLAYDGAGRVLSVKDANGVVTDMEYTPRGWLSRRLVRGTNNASETDDQITRFEYEPYGAINKVIQPDGSFLRYHYDAAHRLTAISDAGGDRIDYTLDAAGNRLKEETKDPSGNVKRLLARQFDLLSRMRSQINAPFAAMSNLDDPTVKKARFQYDANGNNELVTDALDVVTDNDFDALNRLIKSIGDQGAGGINATSQFTYDARDHLRTVTDPKGLVTTYTYDGLDNLTQLQSPDTGSTVYTHDEAGNRVTQTDARGVSSTYGYDALNRLTTVGFTNSSKNLSFVYDTVPGTCRADEHYSVGRLSRFTDETGSTEFCYDRRGQLVRRTSVVAGETFEMAWGYDNAGRVASQTYPTGTVVAYGRDNRGRINAIDVTPANGSTTALISDVAYLPFGPVGTITWGDQSTLARRYDQNYWIDQIESSQPEGLVLDFSEDVVGNIVSLSDTLAPTLPSDSYGYDDLYRLTTQNSAAGVTQYAYDATGNRSSVTTSSGATAYAYPSGSHRLQAVGGSTRGYDANGNTTGMNGKTLSYDERNRLAVVDLGFSGAVESRYNARGERVVRAQSAFGVVTETRYVYDEGGRLLLELPSKKGASPAEVVWLDDLPVGLIDKNGEVRPIEPDHLGSPRKVTDPSRGTALWDWPILGNAFGTAAANDDPDGDGNATTLNLRFPGQQYDAATGLHYNYFRDYDPATGRYVESDPIGLKGGVSTYGYVMSVPVMALDPQGLEAGGMYNYKYHPEYELAPPPPLECSLEIGINLGFNGFGLNTSAGFVDEKTMLPDFGAGLTLCCKPSRQCGTEPPQPFFSDPFGRGAYHDISVGGRRKGASIKTDGSVCVSYTNLPGRGSSVNAARDWNYTGW